MKNRFKKTSDIFAGADKPVNVIKTGKDCLCGSSDCVHYILVSKQDANVVVCEKCVKNFMHEVRPLMQSLGTLFCISVYALIGEFHIKEERLKKIRNWTPEYFENMKNLCCMDASDREEFDKHFNPDYRSN